MASNSNNSIINNHTVSITKKKNSFKDLKRTPSKTRSEVSIVLTGPMGCGKSGNFTFIILHIKLLSFISSHRFENCVRFLSYIFTLFYRTVYWRLRPIFSWVKKNLFQINLFSIKSSTLIILSIRIKRVVQHQVRKRRWCWLHSSNFRHSWNQSINNSYFLFCFC